MIRNLIFSIFFFTGIVVISLFFLPAFFLPQKVVLFGGKLMGYWTGFCLNLFLKTKIVIKGKENIIINEKFFGWYLKKIGSISIQRNRVTKDNLNFFNNIKRIINNSERPLIIFPQGTRVLPNERPPFKKGASRIYKELKIMCQPVVVNSGHVWPKNGLKKSHKTITISILQPISAGYSKEEFINILETNIYSELNLLN